MRKMKKRGEKGITLIALVVTIVILLILAGVTISMLTGENGVINNAQDAKSKTNIAAVKEKVELVILNWKGEILAGKNLGINDLWGEMKEEGIIESIGDDIRKAEETTENGITTTLYEIDTKEGYQVNLVHIIYKNGEQEVYIDEVVNNEKALPKVTLSVVSKTKNSITVKAETRRTEGKLIYSYKLEGETTYTKYKETTEKQIMIENLQENKKYNIKVEVSNKNGTVEALATAITKSELQAETIQASEIIWANGTATVKLTTTTEYGIQYQINKTDENGWINYTEEGITGMTHNSIVYARIYNGENVSQPTQISIKDENAPSAPSLSVTSGTTGDNGWYRSNVIVTIVPGTDGETGVNNTTYTITGAQTLSETPGTVVTITAEGTSTITAYTYDTVGNKSVAGTIVIKKDTVGPVFNGLTDTSYRGSVAINNGVTVTDATSGMSSNTAFTYTPTSLINGENIITYTATDNAGNTTTQTRKIIYDSTCFVAGTKVSTVEGLRNIEDLKVGDIVFTYNEETQNIEEKEIIETFSKESNILVTITFENGEKIQNTKEHPYYVVDKGWKETKDLQVGDEILTQDKTKVKITNLEINEVEKTKVYNMTVADNHNYFVGNDKYLVHNSANGGCGLEDYPIE